MILVLLYAEFAIGIAFTKRIQDTISHGLLNDLAIHTSAL